MEQSSKRRILLVDDDSSLLTTLGDFLRFEGYDVKCVSSGEEAIVAMRPFNPDLVILDMGMPGMGGTGFIDRIIRKDGMTLFPVLVLTARASMAEYFADKQVAGFVAKPADQNDLLQEIGRILFENPRRPEDAASRGILGELVLVDPDADRASALTVEFARIGFNVNIAKTGIEAIDMVANVQPILAAVSADLTDPMPAKMLADTLRRMTVVGGRLPVLVYGTDNLPADPECVVVAATALVAE